MNAMLAAVLAAGTFAGFGMAVAANDAGARLDEALAIPRYFAHVAKDGDYANDWLTHMDEDTRAWVLPLGQELAEACGC